MKENKRFFFEKKNQKTFALGGMGVGDTIVSKAWMPAFAGMTGWRRARGTKEQKFLGRLFSKRRVLAL